MANLRSITFNGDTSTVPEIDATLSVAGKVADAKATGDAIEDVIENIAPEYDSTATYDAGEYVSYNGDIYKANTDITTAEAWTPAHWEQVTVGEELSDVKADINQTQNDILAEKNRAESE